jgi:sigma-E factor negative regulatory protein RseB
VFLCALCVATVGAPAPNTPATQVETSAMSPVEWLERMNRAFVEHNYDGVISYYSGADLATMRVVHKVDKGVQKERLVHLNGAPREIIRTGDKVDCILQPGDEMLELEGNIPTGPFARAFTRRFDQVSSNYAVSVHGTDRIAGRGAVRIAITPHDEDRYGYRLWLDADTGMLLRSELIDMRGQRLEIFQFATIRLDQPIDPSALLPDADEDAVTSVLTLGNASTPKPAPGTVRWRAGWVPNGFIMAAWDVRQTPSTSKDVNTLMYSDGLAAFSVFIEDMPDVGAGSLISRNGATVAVTHVVSADGGEAHLVTVVGEVPTPTAQRVARSVHFVER